MIPINRNGNCTTDLIGSGGRSCDIQSYGDVLGPVLHPKGWSKNVATATITAESWKDEYKAFNAIPYLGVYDFTQDTPENETATSSTGIMSTIRVGKPQFTFSFDRGGCFHKSLYNKRGKNRWDLSLMFETGILFATNADGSEISGFDMGLFDVGTFRLQQGTDPQQSTAMIQLVDAEQFNTQFTFLTWAELGANLSKIEGVVEANVSYQTTPATGDTEVIVQVASSCNYDDVILGFDATANWRLGGNSTRTITGVTYDTETQAYTLTLSAALVDGTTVQPTLIGGDYDVAEDDLGGLYKGRAELVTIAEPTT